MRYLGVDYGDKKIGVALSDEAGQFAFPKETLANDHRSVARLSEMAHHEKAVAIIVGDTRSLSGRPNTITPEADRFSEALALASGLKVVRVREAFSSAEAMRYAPNGQRHDDSAAAAIILQRFLDDNR